MLRVAPAVWVLGLTQIVGYGTLYYSFPILVADVASEFGTPEQWLFGAFSAALLLASLAAPAAGRLADRYGACQVMTIGSGIAAVALAACAIAPDRYSFAAALITMQVSSCFVLYAAAFIAIVQTAGVQARAAITHLTLIAGFASTIFWPLTTWLHQTLSWREVYLLFAAMNLVVCLPLHAWLAAGTRRRAAASIIGPPGELLPEEPAAPAPPGRVVFVLMMAGFASSGFVLSAFLVHMVPLMGLLGLGASGVAVAALFGPAQVASRFINMVLGASLQQTMLAVVATAMLAAALIPLIAIPVSVAGVAAFIVLLGMASGVLSIIAGTLPLEVFGRAAYGVHVGWMSAARQFVSALSPFVFSLLMAGTSVTTTLLLFVGVALLSVLVFACIAMIRRRGVQA